MRQEGREVFFGWKIIGLFDHSLKEIDFSIWGARVELEERRKSLAAYDSTTKADRRAVWEQQKSLEERNNKIIKRSVGSRRREKTLCRNH